MSASVERELKLLAPEQFELPPMDDVLPGVACGQPTRFELDATYYDTKDLALARSGVTLRYRTEQSGSPWTVKLPDHTNGNGIARLEIRVDGDEDAVPVAARDLVRAYTRTHRLRRVARLHTARTSVPLLDGEGHQAAELVDDLVTGHPDGRADVVFREVELELMGTKRERRLQRMARQRLTSAGCRAQPQLPKLVRVLGAPAEQPPDVIVGPLAAHPSTLDAVRHALAASVDKLVRHDAGVRLGDDPEEVHQFRVAARTLRSNLKTFAAVLDPEWAGVLRTELAWLGTAAGALRDLDVLEQRLRRESADFAADDTSGLEVAFVRLGQQRETARRSALAAMRCHRYDSLLEALVDAARQPRLAPGAQVDRSARPLLRRVSRTQVRRLDRVASGTADPPTETDLHLVRIQAKRARYAIEAARPVIGAPAAEHAAALARLQDVLGDFHDSTVAVQWLRDAAAARPACGVAAGQLIAVERGQQAALRRDVSRVWRAITDKDLRAWL